MKLTIIPEDKIVVIDGVARQIDFEMNENYHAIQWDGEKGNIETKQGADIKLEDIDAFQDVIDEHFGIIAQEKEDRLAYEADPQRKTEMLASVRYEHEVSGIEVEGVRFWTSRDSRAAWLKILGKAEADGNFIQPVYKAMNGYFTNLPAAQIIEADQEGEDHINKCYLAELAVLGDIENVELADIEEAFLTAYDGITL